MSITTEAKRVKTGQSLTSFQTSAISSVSQLAGIKTNLLTLKTQMSEDADYTAEDVAEVNAVIADLAARVQSLLE